MTGELLNLILTFFPLYRPRPHPLRRSSPGQRVIKIYPATAFGLSTFTVWDSDESCILCSVYFYISTVLG